MVINKGVLIVDTSETVTFHKSIDDGIADEILNLPHAYCKSCFRKEFVIEKQ